MLCFPDDLQPGLSKALLTQNKHQPLHEVQAHRTCTRTWMILTGLLIELYIRVYLSTCEICCTCLLHSCWYTYDLWHTSQEMADPHWEKEEEGRKRKIRKCNALFQLERHWSTYWVSYQSTQEQKAASPATWTGLQYSASREAEVLPPIGEGGQSH